MQINKIFRITLKIAVILIMPGMLYAQDKRNWQHLDLQQDSVFGISTSKAYHFLKGRSSSKVIVAVNDGGVESVHEDLKRIMWNNAKEIAGNGKDDDKNGYVDDVNGWNFLGEVNFETLELTRLVRRDLSRFSLTNETNVAEKDKNDFFLFKKRKLELDNQLAEAKKGLAGISGFKLAIDSFIEKIGIDDPNVEDIKKFKPSNKTETQIQFMLATQLSHVSFKDFYEKQIKQGVEHYQRQIDYNLNLTFEPRNPLSLLPSKKNNRFLGNNDVAGPDAMHGSHVAGIIAADRNNDVGIMGVADQAVIMAVRCVPNGDERDQDVAKAIRYAVDNGAKIINMSFGKSYSWDKKMVDDAIKYAVSKDVLLVQAAGNDNRDIDIEDSFPNRKGMDAKTIGSWITVGASGPIDNNHLKANFSNYGKSQVDVFAPGVQIYSTIPGSQYGVMDGTSMASPVVAGIAALIRSYFPGLSAAEVKEIIMNSVNKVNHDVTCQKGDQEHPQFLQVPFSDLCVTGGIVNAYKAVKLASDFKSNRSVVN